MRWLSVTLKKSTDISPVIKVIPRHMTIETTLHDLGKLHGRSNSKLCLLHV